MSMKNGTAAVRARKSRTPKTYKAVIWKPYHMKKPKVKAADRVLPMRAPPMGVPGMGTPPSTTSTIAATRSGAMVTLTYTLHATSPITHVIVTYNTGSGANFVSEWSADLHVSPSNDVYMPPTVASIGDLPPQANIEVRYNTTAAQNYVVAASTNV